MGAFGPVTLRTTGLQGTAVRNLEFYCAAYGRFRLAEEDIAKNGITVLGAQGGVVKSPAATIINEATRQMATFGSLLGLDPSSRHRLLGPKGEDPIAELATCDMSKAKFPRVAAATQFARDAVRGKIPCCRYLKQACQRHLDDLGKSKKRITLEPWQLFGIACTFGWVHKKNGLRRFRESYWEVLRKNGKSVIGAGVGLGMFCADGEFGAEVYSGATTEKQAWEVFRPARLMVERTPELKRLLGVAWGCWHCFIGLPSSGLTQSLRCQSCSCCADATIISALSFLAALDTWV